MNKCWSRVGQFNVRFYGVKMINKIFFDRFSKALNYAVQFINPFDLQYAGPKRRMTKMLGIYIEIFCFNKNLLLQV